MPNDINRKIAETFLAIADSLETGSLERKPRIAVTAFGSEHGEENVIQGALQAAAKGIEVLYIGTLYDPSVTTINANCEYDAQNRMEELLVSGKADAAVTMHYPFPVGVSTVGLSKTPSKGRSMFMSTTTGTSSTDRAESLVLNTIAGIIAAKSCGISKPTIGILNIEGAHKAANALSQLEKGGYELCFASSGRSDGGYIMRGNDVLTGAPDIMITDSLTGNILSKMLSSFTSGGSFEVSGCGYGPGIGKGFERIVMIVSRASGAPVISGAIEYAARLVKGKMLNIAKEEYLKAEKAGLKDILESLKGKAALPEDGTEIVAPPKEIATAQIMGIEISELEDAVRVLWKSSVYAQSGMGCTGPVIMVSETNYQKALELLKDASYLPK